MYTEGLRYFYLAYFVSQILSRTQQIKIPRKHWWWMQSYYLQRLSCSSLHVSSDTHAPTGTTTVLFLINAAKYKELSQPNIFEAVLTLGKWWTVESKRCVGICWFTLPFRKKLSTLKCVSCALIKINYVALKSKIFWFNKHFFQWKVSLLDNLQMFDLVLILNCFTLSLQWQKFL